MGIRRRTHWRLRYWLGGKEKSLSLGVYPAVRLKAARTKREAERKHLDNKLDRSAERKAASLRESAAIENSFEAVAIKWSIKLANTWVASHALDVTRRLEKNIFPMLGHRPIADIEAPELLATVHKIEGRGAHDLPHRVLSVCGQVFRHGVATGRRKSDISKDLRGALTPHKPKKQAAVRLEELPALLRAIASYDETGD